MPRYRSNQRPHRTGTHDDAPCRSTVDRRAFMAGTLSTVVGGAIGFSHGRRRAVAADAAVGSGMPGPYPGRVIEVGHTGSVVGGEFRSEPVRAMMARGMTELTGADDAPSAWRSLFARGDVVGVKVNPVGKPLAISNHVTVHAIVDGLKSAGVRARDIIVFTRYGDLFAEAGYRDHAPDGVQVETAVAAFDSVQLGIKGYDPDVFAHMDFIHETLHDPKDDRARRSHVCTIVTRKINKLVNVPVLKDHGSAGITGALKNLSHGLANNVSRSHGTAQTNTCNVFIPAVCALEPIRQKNVLNIMDGLVAVYQLGPFGAEDSPYTWPYRALFFSTDPVAMDRVEWDIIDAQRAEKGLAAVAKTGRMGVNDSGREGFDIRQPQHVLLAGGLGLGVHDPAKITHKKIKLT